MKIITNIDEMKKISMDIKHSSPNGRVSFVPTMGKLHDGHANLVREALKYGETVVSIFVNPMQFGPDEDFGRYPRDLDSDASLLKKLGVKFLFYPGLEIAGDTETFLINNRRAKILEGVYRPEHFMGVLTIVMKLFSIVRPNRAFFGLKDYQQYILIKKMAADYFLDAEVVAVETAREKCGLAMSSRNSYFSEPDKKAACYFYDALKKASELFASGEKSSVKIINFAAKELIGRSFSINYLKIMDAELKEEAATVQNGDILLSAVNFKGVRLIDNIFLGRKIEKRPN